MSQYLPNSNIYGADIDDKILFQTDRIKTAFVDVTDPDKRFVAVQVKFKQKLNQPVTLENIKKTKELQDLSLVKQSRLSVTSIDPKSWKILCKMGKL